MKTVCVLIDNMYLENLSRDYDVYRIDIEKFSDNLLNKDEERFMTYVFDALPFVPDNPTQEQKDRKDGKKRYLDKLQYLNRVTVEWGQVRPKHTRCRECGKGISIPIQKLVDVKLSVRLVALASSERVDKICLITGDKDLLPAVEATDNSGTIVKLLYGETEHASTSKALIRACHEKEKLTREDLEYCRLQDRNP